MLERISSTIGVDVVRRWPSIPPLPTMGNKSALPRMPMRHAPLAFLLALPGSIATAAPESHEGLFYQHLDWVVACDNTRTCRAAGYSGSSDSPLSVLLTREGGPDQVIEGRLALQPDKGQAQPKGLLNLRIQKQDLGALTPDTVAGMYSMSATQTRALLSALVSDGGIKVTDNTGQRWTLSDKGAAAVLLKIDEYQGRLGTPGAMLRTGSSPEAGVLAAQPATVIRQASTLDSTRDDAALTTIAASVELRAALLATPKGPQCEGLLAAKLDPSISNSPLKVRRLDAVHLLVSVPCWHAAQNDGVGYWVIREQPPFQPSWVTNDAYHYENGQIVAYRRELGPVECTFEYTWTWNGARFIGTSAVRGVMCGPHALDGVWKLPTLVSEIR
ncbi:DUF1176 domain-containing protein [Stenotrophomonas pavanii]|uniref:DUF1176 domain-containing protein n=2 Tax=Stenotrophomonas pavanii TaxID=487698 RepID=UPI002E763689|nr:DUF1176 domain-containing protein [Stenotrophomonas pavanii]